MRLAVAITIVLLLPGPSQAAPVVSDASLVPGRMGYNALPALGAADPDIEDELSLELSLVAQASDLPDATDASALPYVRLSVPFQRVAALDVDAIPFEAWRVGPATQQRLDAVHATGTTKGDIRFAARFALLREGSTLPAVGIRLFTKTASGKGAEDRRFLNAPAYGADALFGKDLPWTLGPFSARFVASAGLLVWQQGAGRQDDAFDAAARVALRTEQRTHVALQWRGYWGYQHLDKPMVLGITAGRRVVRPLELLASVDRGLTSDAPPWEARLGVVLHVDVGELPWGAAAPPRALTR